MILVTFVMILFTSIICGQISISSISPSSGSVLPVGSTATLTCASNLPWYICIWEGPGGLACQCQSQVGGVNALCQGYPQLTLTGSGNDCRAVISGVTMEDAGQWRCVMVDNTQFKSVSRTIDLDVGKEAQVAWLGARNQISVVERESTELVCQSLGGYPEPQLTVEGSENVRPGRPATLPSGISPFLDVSLPASYTGNRNDHDKPLSCVSTQLDSFGNILYTSRADLRLDIKAAIDAGALGIPVGGIVGILLAILVLFLLCAILACILFRRQRNEKYGVDNQFIASSKGGYTSVPVEHDILVTGGDDLEKNYDVNINQIYNDRFHKSENINLIENNKLQESSETLEDYLVTGLARRGSNSSSSSSSSSSGKSKLIKTASSQQMETDHGITKKNDNFTNHYWNNSTTISSTVQSKHDSTFIYNGKKYEEEVFEDHLQTAKSKFPMPAKFRSKRWKNNLSEIREGDHDEEVQTMKHDNHINLYSLQLEQETARQTINENEREMKTNYNENRNIILAQKQTSSSKDVTVEQRHECLNNNFKNNFDAFLEQKESKVKKQKIKKNKNIIVEKVSNKTSHEDSVESLKKKNDQIFSEIGNMSGSRSSNHTSGHLDVSHSAQETEFIKQDIQVYSDESSEKSKYTFRDDHYYIGDSEYAEVVEEHVQGKYEDDIEYCEEKLKHTVDVKPKIWTLKDIKIEESNLQRTSTMRAPKILPPPELTTESKKEYIVNWISTENLQVSPTLEKSLFGEETRNSSFDQELDRSDESCIVEAEQRSMRSNPASSGARYQHISDFVNMKQNIQAKPTDEDKKLRSKSSISNQVSNTQIEKSNAETMHVYSNHSSKCLENISPCETGQVSFSGKRKPKSILKNHSTDELVTDQNSKTYMITQQEIVFYLKNKDGILKVVRRPLLHTQRSSQLPSEEKENSFIRHKSQPNLYSSHILRHLDESCHEVAGGVEVSAREDGSQHIHMRSVGLLQHSLSLRQLSGLQDGDWRSSGSIFDCEMNCFNDNSSNM